MSSMTSELEESLALHKSIIKYQSPRFLFKVQNFCLKTRLSVFAHLLTLFQGIAFVLKIALQIRSNLNHTNKTPVNLYHPLQRVKVEWNSDFRFGGKSAAASKSLLFSFVLNAFQAISVIFFNSTDTRRRISDLSMCR